MAIISDNEIDRDIAKMKAFTEALKKTQAIFANSFKTLPAKERARLIQKIQADQKTLGAFLEKAKTVEIYNSGTKFGIENLKQAHQTLLTLWKKTEKNLENYGSALGASSDQSDSSDEAGRAVDSYAQALKNLGHQPSPAQLQEFKERLSAAYKTAQEKSGGRDLAIKIVQDGGKIKVRMEPK